MNSNPASWPPWSLRLAAEADIPGIAVLIPLSVRSLQAAYYSPRQMEAALGPVFAVDRQLIADGSFFVAEAGEELVGCGGWSRRRALYGGNDGVTAAEGDGLLDPKRDSAKIRAFFVHPGWARRGIGRGILIACESAAMAAGFSRLEMVATLAGEPLYAANGYAVAERYQIALGDGLSLPVVRMTKRFDTPPV